MRKEWQCPHATDWIEYGEGEHNFLVEPLEEHMEGCDVCKAVWGKPVELPEGFHERTMRIVTEYTKEKGLIKGD